MCGIIFIKKIDSVRKGNNFKTVDELKKAYQAQKSRGSQGFGYIALQEGGLCYERTETEDEISEKLSALTQPDEIMFHHRYPTSTKNIAECAHPIKVDNPELEHIFYGVHNGVITNPETLKEKHEAMGYEYNTEIKIVNREEIITRIPSGTGEGLVNGYSTEREMIQYNDSEALIIELARYASGKSYHIATQGTVAFMLWEVERETGKVLALHYGRNNGNPLTKRKENRHLIIASQGGDIIPANRWHTYDYVTGEEEVEDMAIGGYFDTKSSNSTYTGGTTSKPAIGFTATKDDAPDDDASYSATDTKKNGNGYSGSYPSKYDDPAWLARNYPEVIHGNHGKNKKNRKKRYKNRTSEDYHENEAQQQLEWDKEEPNRALITTIPVDREPTVRDLTAIETMTDAEMAEASEQATVIEREQELWEAQCQIFDDYIKKLIQIQLEIKKAEILSDFDLQNEWEDYAEVMTGETRELLGEENFDYFMETQLDEEDAKEIGKVEREF